MELKILGEGVDQAVSMAENVSTEEGREEVLRILGPELKRLTDAVMTLSVKRFGEDL